MDTAVNDYIISGGQPGKNRLNVLSEVLQTYDEVLLKEHGLTTGMSFLDVGTGGGNVAIMAARMVGDTGRVTAIDFDKEIVTLDQQDAAAAYVSNITFQSMSAYNIAYENEYDIAYARFLLSHLKSPLDVLLKMRQSVRPGGKVIVQDVHFSGHFSYPACEAFDKYIQYYTATAQHKGEDANIGPSLPSLFRKAGLQQVGFDTIQPCFNTGNGKWMAYLTLNNIKETLIATNIASREEINAMLLQLKDFTGDAQTIISLPRIFRVWGIKA